MNRTERKLLADLDTALLAWLHLYAADQVDENEHLRYVKMMYEEGGTLKYIAELRRRVKRTLEPGRIAR